MRPIRRILVAIKDPAVKSTSAVKKAAQLAQAFGAELELHHTIATTLSRHPIDDVSTLPLAEGILR